MHIERAHPDDVAAVEALLSAAGLPLEGAADALATGVVARDGEMVVGAAAVERFGDAALLRSVVVAPDRRGSGLGRQVVAAAESLAQDEGVRVMYLLTETAVDWFPRLGYDIVPREVAVAAVGESIEFTTVCATSSVSMRRVLEAPFPKPRL